MKQCFSANNKTVHFEEQKEEKKKLKLKNTLSKSNIQDRTKMLSKMITKLQKHKERKNFKSASPPSRKVKLQNLNVTKN